MALIVDSEYGFRMAAAVEWLLEKGFRVAVVCEDFFVGRGLVESAEMLWFGRVAERGVVFHPRMRVAEANGESVVCRDRFSGREQVFDHVAMVVHAQPEAPADGLYRQLREAHPSVITVGDARAPRLMGEAIHHAHRAVLLDE